MPSFLFLIFLHFPPRMCNCHSPLIKWKLYNETSCMYVRRDTWMDSERVTRFTRSLKRLCTAFSWRFYFIHLEITFSWMKRITAAMMMVGERNWNFLWPLKNGSWRMGSNNRMHISCSLFEQRNINSIALGETSFKPGSASVPIYERYCFKNSS